MNYIFFSGLVAYEPQIALKSLNTPNLSSGVFHSIVKNPGSGLSAVRESAGGISFISSTANQTLSYTRTGSNIAHYISNSRFLTQSTSYITPIAQGAFAVGLISDWTLTGFGLQHWSESLLNSTIQIVGVAIGGWYGIPLYFSYNLGKSYMKMIMKQPEWALYEYRGFTH